MEMGLISVFCAIGTVVGLAIIVFGFARNATLIKLSGVLTFIVCFAGLFYILAKFGYKPEEVASSESAEHWKIMKWSEEVLHADSSIYSTNLLLNWESTPQIIIEEHTARIGHGSTGWVQRNFSRTDSSWNFGVATKQSPPLTGIFRISGDLKNEVMLLKELKNRRESIWLVRSEGDNNKQRYNHLTE